MKTYEVDYTVVGKVSVLAEDAKEAIRRARSLRHESLLAALDWESLEFHGAHEVEVGGGES